jgi:Reverse transcriptase (RNA-dependent DNA polymerase)
VWLPHARSKRGRTDRDYPGQGAGKRCREDIVRILIEQEERSEPERASESGEGDEPIQILFAPEEGAERRWKLASVAGEDHEEYKINEDFKREEREALRACSRSISSASRGKSPDGHYQFRRMPFGLCNAPAAFQRMMNHVLGLIKWKKCLVFMDELLILGREFVELLKRLTRVLAALGKAGLKFKVRCEFGMTSTTYLGHPFSEEGVAPDPMKVEAIASFPWPTDLRWFRWHGRLL